MLGALKKRPFWAKLEGSRCPPIGAMQRGTTVHGTDADPRTMPREDVIAILRCPDDRSALATADDELISRLNGMIRQGRLQTRAGRRVEKLLDGGFVRAAGDVLYPVVDQIPVLLRDEAITLDQ